jgi:hypothetical protein
MKRVWAAKSIAFFAQRVLTRHCDYRTMHLMQRLTDAGIEALGGLKAVSELTKAPTSTVFAWKRRISASRLDHLKLAAQAAGKHIDWTAALADAAEDEAA